VANGEWRMCGRPEWLIGGGYVVSETHPRPFPKGKDAPSGEGSSVKSVGSEAHGLSNQEGSPYPLGRVGDGFLTRQHSIKLNSRSCTRRFDV
jgi:hypothetical protein